MTTAKDVHNFLNLQVDGITAYAFAVRAGQKNHRRNDFIAPARRALRRAARKAREENRRFGLPLITGKNGKRAGK